MQLKAHSPSHRALVQFAVYYFGESEIETKFVARVFRLIGEMPIYAAFEIITPVLGCNIESPSRMKYVLHGLANFFAVLGKDCDFIRIFLCIITCSYAIKLGTKVMDTG